MGIEKLSFLSVLEEMEARFDRQRGSRRRW